MICNKCGKEIPENSTFCVYCGAKQNIESNGSSEENNSTYNEQNNTNQAQQNTQTAGNYQQQNVYYAPAQPGVSYRKKAITGFTLGIISLVLCWIPVVPLITGIIGLVKSIKALKMQKRIRENKTYAILGIVFNSVAIVMSLILCLYYFIIFAIIGASGLFNNGNLSQLPNYIDQMPGINY